MGSEGWREETKLEMGKVSRDRFYSHLFKKVSQRKKSKMRNIFFYPRRCSLELLQSRVGAPFPRGMLCKNKPTRELEPRGIP